MTRILLFICLLYSSISFGQLEFKNSNVGRVMDAMDINGNSLLRKYDPDITGSPFINDDWVLAKLTLSKGKEIGPLPIKMNIESNELYYRDSTGKEMIVVEGLVRKVDCLNYYSKDSIRYVFKNGYPAIDKQNENYYYQALTQGKIQLLAKKSKYIRTEKDELSGKISQEFVDAGAVLYIYSYGIMQPFHSSKSFISSLFEADKEQVMDKFITDNKINFKKTVDLIKSFNYYNSLPYIEIL